MSQSTRRKAIEQSYQSMRPVFQSLSRVVGVGVGGACLDVGSGEGILSIIIAQDLQARRIILTDQAHRPVVGLPPHAEFHFADVQSEAFVQQFQNQANAVVCLCVLHEVANPVSAAVNLIRLLPIGGAGLSLDYAAPGWAQERAIAAAGAEHYPGHFKVVRVVRQLFGVGWDTDAGIRFFWESLFPRLPGECCLTCNGDLSSLFYIPRQWGEAQKPPPAITRMLQSRQRYGGCACHA